MKKIKKVFFLLVPVFLFAFAIQAFAQTPLSSQPIAGYPDAFRVSVRDGFLPDTSAGLSSFNDWVINRAGGNTNKWVETSAEWLGLYNSYASAQASASGALNLLPSDFLVNLLNNRWGLDSSVSVSAVDRYSASYKKYFAEFLPAWQKALGVPVTSLTEVFSGLVSAQNSAAPSGGSGQSTPTQSSSGLKIGDKVVVSADAGVSLNVRSAPSTSATILGTQPVGATGTIVAGPTSANGYVWWNIDYASGADGWSVDKYLSSFGSNTSQVVPVSQSIVTSSVPATSAGICYDIGIEAYKDYVAIVRYSGGLPHSSVVLRSSAEAKSACSMIVTNATQNGGNSVSFVTTPVTQTPSLVPTQVPQQPQNPTTPTPTGTAPTVKLDIRGTMGSLASSGKLNLQYGEGIILKWSSTNAVDCTMGAPFNSTFTPNVPVAYAQSGYIYSAANLFAPNSMGTTYTMTCVGSSGMSGSDSVTVYGGGSPSTNPPPFGLVLDQTSYVQGGVKPILTWFGKFNEGYSCTASNDGSDTSWIWSNVVAGQYYPSAYWAASQEMSPTKTTTYTMTCTGPNGFNLSKSVIINVGSNNTGGGVPVTNPQPPQASTVDLKINGSDGPLSVPVGTTLNLNWTSQNISASGCTFSSTPSGPLMGAVQTSGSYVINGLVSSVYNINCGNVSDSVNVGVYVVDSFPPVPPTTAKFSIGDNVVMTSNLNIRSSAGTASPLVTTSIVGTKGVITSGPVSANGYNWYELTLQSGLGGWAVEDYLEKVGSTGSSKITLSATPSTVSSGSQSVIKWDAPGATTCSGLGATNFTYPASGSITITPTQTTTYTLNCWGGSFSSASQSVTITVTPASTTGGACAINSFTVNPASVLVNGDVTLSWSTSNCDFIVLSLLNAENIGRIYVNKELPRGDRYEGTLANNNQIVDKNILASKTMILTGWKILPVPQTTFLGSTLVPTPVLQASQQLLIPVRGDMLGAPTLTSVTTDSKCGGYIKLNWTEVPGATAYKLYRNGSATPFYTTPFSVLLGWTDGPLTPGLVYQYTVKATNGTSDSASSNQRGASASAICQ